MKIDKAIEVLGIENRLPWNHSGSDLRDAVKLGIEALKREKYGRVQQPANVIRLLPGETD